MEMTTNLSLVFSEVVDICMNEDPLPVFKGNNSCKTNNFRMKVGNVQIFYLLPSD